MRIPLVRRGDDTTPIAWWEWLFVPAMFLAMCVIALLSIPYFWLYPERHAHPFDMGTLEEKQQLNEYRKHRRRVSLFRRLLEKARIAPFDAGPRSMTDHH